VIKKELFRVDGFFSSQTHFAFFQSFLLSSIMAEQHQRPEAGSGVELPFIMATNPDNKHALLSPTSPTPVRDPVPQPGPAPLQRTSSAVALDFWDGVGDKCCDTFGKCCVLKHGLFACLLFVFLTAVTLLVIMYQLGGTFSYLVVLWSFSLSCFFMLCGLWWFVVV
jgi:hypothetical protein